MERFYDGNLNQLRLNLNRMAEFAYANVNNAIKALIEKDLELVRKVIDADGEINELNKWVDQHVVEHITLRSPVASDVRFLYTTLKGSRDLERAGDEASSIAKRARKIIRSGYSGDLYDIQTLCRLATTQLNEAMSSFLKSDIETARNLRSKDKQVDKLYKSIDKQINSDISNNGLDPKDVPAMIDLLFISKSLERVGDHAVNIGNEVIYLITGEDVRYTEDTRN